MWQLFCQIIDTQFATVCWKKKLHLLCSLVFSQQIQIGKQSSFTYLQVISGTTGYFIHFDVKTGFHFHKIEIIHTQVWIVCSKNLNFSLVSWYFQNLKLFTKINPISKVPDTKIFQFKIFDKCYISVI